MTTHTNRIRSETDAGENQVEWQQQLQHYEECITDSVRENPLTATMIVFGVGFGIGTLIGSMMGESTSSRHQRMAHSLGRRMMNSLSDVMPASAQQYLRS